ncbi:MAG TPA: MarR family transcriptional regulator [Eubacteriaceae bacterium]|jgi:DNA-binding MarR family transcriptional regulator|nr:MarR family transcriptional regulator [Eubacteriaceae bacterium]
MYDNDVDEMTHSAYMEFSQLLRYHYKRLHVLLEEINIYPGQPPLLFILADKGGLSQKELAEKVNIKASTMTTMIKCMENNDIVTKVQDENDKRVTRVFLTENGRDTVAKAKKIMRQMGKEAFKGFTEGEKEALKGLLTRMKSNYIELCIKDD